MAYHVAKAIAVISVVAGLGGLLVAGAGPGRQPEKPGDFVFSQSLEAVLDRGVAKGDDHAKRACLALLFSDDPVLIETASNVLAVRHKLAGADTLSRALKILRGSKRARDGKSAEARLLVVLSFADHLDDGWGYVDAAVLHLNSKNGFAAGIASIELRDSHLWLSKEARTRNIRLPHAAAELQRGSQEERASKWREVLKALGEEPVRAAMSRKFAKERKAVERHRVGPSR